MGHERDDWNYGMKSIIAFLLGYLAANYIASHGGLSQVLSSVGTTQTTATPTTTGIPYSPAILRNFSATMRVQ